MKQLLVVVAVALQLVCPGSTNPLRPLRQLHSLVNVSLPEHLRTTMVPIMKDCDKNTFCKVQQVLVKHAGDDKIQKLYRSLESYNQKTHKNCTGVNVEVSDGTVTTELQSFLNIFQECIRKENMRPKSEGH